MARLKDILEFNDVDLFNDNEDIDNNVNDIHKYRNDDNIDDDDDDDDDNDSDDYEK